MRVFIAMLGLLVVAACTQPEPYICDREAQTWHKFGTQEDECIVPAAAYIPPPGTVDDPHDPTTPPSEPPCECHEPPSEPPTPPQPPEPPEPPKEPPSEPPAGKQKGNNGLGNGNQPAPGGSLPNNKAENQVGNPGHASGKAQKSD